MTQLYPTLTRIHKKNTRPWIHVLAILIHMHISVELATITAMPGRNGFARNIRCHLATHVDLAILSTILAVAKHEI